MDKKKSRSKNGFVLFAKALRETKHSMWVSAQIFIAITILLIFVLFFAEHSVNPNFSWGDAVVWPIVQYVQDPASITNPPVTIVGKIFGTIVGYLNIGLFAVLAGLIGSGFVDAMNEDKRKNELDEVRDRIHKSFKRLHSTSFNDFCYKKKIEDKFYFAPRRVPVAKLQVRGMKLDDIIDVVNKFSEFRLKNMASGMSMEEHPDDRLVVEHFPLNTDYGCKIDRKSKITIVSTSSRTENGTGWLAFHLAKLGGFNYISKDLEVDPDEPDSFYNMSKEIYVKGISESEMRKDEGKYKEELELVAKKREIRYKFKQDLNSLNHFGKDGWFIMILSQIKNTTNSADFHFASCQKDGIEPTVSDMTTYKQLFDEMSKSLEKEFDYSSVQTERYPLKKNNLAYIMADGGDMANCFTIRVSSDIICFDPRTHFVLYQMAQIINNNLGGNGLHPSDKEDFTKKTIGYNSDIEIWSNN